MKKITLSLVTILATSTLIVAGGNVPSEATEVAVIETEMAVEAPSNNGFYAGIAYGYEELNIDRERNGNSLFSEKFGSIMLDLGYKMNENFAIEGRYWSGINSSNDLAWRSEINSDVTVDAWGIYLKPMYPVSNGFDLYALIGYAGGDATYDLAGGGSIESDNVSGFSWGLGAEYSMTNDWSLVLDYTSILNAESGVVDAINTEDSLAVVNIGVNYHF